MSLAFRAVRARSLARVCTFMAVTVVGSSVATAHGVSASTLNGTCSYGVLSVQTISPPLSNTFLFQFGADVRCNSVMSSISMTVYLMESVAGGPYSAITSGRSTTTNSTTDEWSGSYSQACAPGEGVSVYTEADVSITDTAGNTSAVTLTSPASSATCNLTV